jgi:hypothetical protein
MKRPAIALGVVLLISQALAGGTRAADDSKVKAATGEVESGAKKLGQGEIGQGVEETAKGIGKTVEEGAKFTGQKFKESGKAAEPHAKTAWQHTQEGAVAFGHSVKNFFTTLFSPK